MTFRLDHRHSRLADARLQLLLDEADDKGVSGGVRQVYERLLGEAGGRWIGWLHDRREP